MKARENKTKTRKIQFLLIKCGSIGRPGVGTGSVRNPYDVLRMALFSSSEKFFLNFRISGLLSVQQL